MLPMTASSTVGTWLSSSAPCWATSFWAKASASARDRNAAMWTLYLPFVACALAGGGGVTTAVWKCLSCVVGLGSILCSLTTVALLQLDVSGTAGDVEAVVTT